MLSKFKIRVFPGFDDVWAKFFRLIILLINEDLPTFDRPAKANSGRRSLGYCFCDTALMSSSAFVIFILHSHQCRFEHLIHMIHGYKCKVVTTAFWNIVTISFIIFWNDNRCQTGSMSTERFFLQATNR